MSAPSGGEAGRASLGAGGLRREARILLPVVLLLFAALASVTLVSYRSAVTNLTAERQAWTLRQAVALAEQAASRGASPTELASSIPSGASVAILDGRGAVLWSLGAIEPEGLARPSLDGADPSRAWAGETAGATVSGPGGPTGHWIVASAPFSSRAPDGSASRRLLRFANPETTLSAARRSLAILTPVVVVLSAAVALVAIAFLYALNRPLELLLERVREVPPTTASAPRSGVSKARGDDEIDLLFTTFDRALAALRATDGDPSGGARRDAESRLAESVAQLGELSAGVAHELRNSLGTLAGYLGLLARRDLPAAGREELAEALRETAALGRVVDDFLAFTRPGARALENVELGTVVDRALADPSLGDPVAGRAPLARTGATTPVTVRGDERLLGRALRNLLQNAAQAQAASGAREPIEVALGVNADRATITIRDHGEGIAPELAGRLFEPFASARPGGAGLGLALARRIVLLHSGTLRLENHPHGGTVATIVLPTGDSVT